MTKTTKSASSKAAKPAANKAPAKAKTAPAKTANKKETKSRAESAPRRSRAAAVVLADAAPARGAPTPPAGFRAPPKNKKRVGGASPTLQQVRDAGDVAKEVLAESYWDDFGKRAPDPTQLSDALLLAKAWSNELAATESWLIYTRTQNELAWQAVTPMIKVLTPEFRLAQKSDAAIAKKYPQTGDFLNVRVVSAKKGAATRERKKKAAKKAQKPSGS